MGKYVVLFFIVAALAGIVVGVFTDDGGPTYAVHTYQVIDYAGDTRLILATHCRALGPAMVFDLPDGRVLWLIDVAEVEELP